MDAAQSHPHKILVRVLLAVASVLLVLAIFAVWANRQALNADNWSNTSAKVLQEPKVKAQVTTFLVDSLYANADVAGQLRTALPPRLQPLAGPAAGGLRELSYRVTLAMLNRPRAEQIWKAANKVTAQQFINIAEGKSKAVTSQGNAVVLDMRVVLGDLVQRLGLPNSLLDRIPPDKAKIKILKSDQVTVLQDVVSLLHNLALVLPILSFGLFAAAVWLARGRRRRTILWVGIDFIAAAFVVLIARRLLGSYVTDQLAADESVRPAVASTWAIGTHMLRDVAGAVIIAALPLLFAAWLAGPSRYAVASRRNMAPYLYEHQGGAYAAVATVLLLIVIWGPIPATQKVIPVIIMCALAAVGVHQLRKQTLEEFPQGPAVAPTPLEPPVETPPPTLVG